MKNIGLSISIPLISLALATGCSESALAPTEDLCEGVTCSYRGICLVENGSPRCECDQGYSEQGLSCSTTSEIGSFEVDFGDIEDSDAPRPPFCDVGGCEGYIMAVTSVEHPVETPEEGEERPPEEPEPTGPVVHAPGEHLVVTGLGSQLSDIHRSQEGTLLVATMGGDASGHIEVARSDDGGSTWGVQGLGNAGQSTYIGRLFAIGESRIGISGQQGSWYPYDGFLKFSEDDGVSFNDEWLNFSLSSEMRGERNGIVTETPGGRYLAVFPYGGFFWRVSDSLSDWSDTMRHDLFIGEAEGGRAGVAAVDTNILLAVPRSDGGFDTFLSEDDGDSFDLVSHTETEVLLRSTELHVDVGGVLHICGVYTDPGAADDRVYTYVSEDDGLTWGEETMYVGRLQRDVRSVTSCHVDETGVYVGYQDRETGEIRIIPPGGPVECGNGVKEPGEECDGDDLYGRGCIDLGFGGGDLICDDSCSYAVAGCTEATYPTSCDAVESEEDGRYTIDPDGDGSNPPFEVHCHGMDTGDPQEYLPLVVTGSGSNSSHYQYISPDSAVDCQFEMVRIEDLSIMLIDGRDKQFAVCSGNMSSCSACQWGEAAACSGGGPTGSMNIDLSGTPFVIGADVVWQTVGHHPSGGITRDEGPGRIVEATGDGFCGGTTWRTPPGLVLDFAE